MFETKLKQAKAIFEIERYQKHAMPEVLDYLKELKAKTHEGKGTVFNAELGNYILDRETIEDNNLKDYLATEVYLAQQDLRAEQQQAYREHMLSMGYQELKHDVEYRGKIELVAQKSMDWFTNKISIEGTLITAGNGEAFCIPKGRRTKGYYVRNLENAFYKPIN
jgi:hypothetical protein